MVNIRASPLPFTLSASLPVLGRFRAKTQTHFLGPQILCWIRDLLGHEMCVCVGFSTLKSQIQKPQEPRWGYPPHQFPSLSFVPSVCSFSILLPMIERSHTGEEERKLNRPVCLGLPWDAGLYHPGYGGLDPTWGLGGWSGGSCSPGAAVLDWG